MMGPATSVTSAVAESLVESWRLQHPCSPPMGEAFGDEAEVMAAWEGPGHIPWISLHGLSHHFSRPVEIIQ